MNQSIKKIITVSVAVLISTSTLAPGLVQASSTNAITNNIINSQKLHGNAVHENIRKYVEGGMQNINVIRIDLNDTNIEVKPIFSSSGLKVKDTVGKMVIDSNAIAGINGDFFASFNDSSPLGVMVVDGEVVSTATEMQQNIPTIAIDNNNKAFIAYLGTTMSATVNKGIIVDIKSKNKASSTYEDVRLYDKNWASKSIGNKYFKDMVEVVVKNNIVTEVRIGQGPADMPTDGYVLAARKGGGQVLTNNFKVGDTVDLNMSSNPDYKNIKTALGGGSIVLKEGKYVKNPWDIQINGRHPRTAIGISKDRSQLIMVTVDGRSKNSIGVTQLGLAQIMSELGSHEAINLDGGGSTTMVTNVVPGAAPKVENVVSDNSQRKVSNGLGVFKKIGPLEHIELNTNGNDMFTGTTKELQVKGFDQNKNPIEINNKEVIFSVDSSKGQIIENVLHAKEEGNVIVKATYEDKSVNVTMNLFEEVKELKFESEKLEMPINSEKSLGKVFGINNKGLAIEINNKDISWEATNNIGQIKDGIFKSSSSVGQGNIIARFKDKSKEIPVVVDDSMVSINNFDKLGDIRFDKFPQVVTGGITFSDDFKQGTKSLRLSYDFTKTDSNRAAYVVLGEKGINLQGKPKQLGMWVNGDKSNHWVRGTIRDSANVEHSIDFAKIVDWEGWRWVTADIPQDIAYPVNIEKVYLVSANPNNKNKGEILMDDLNVLY